MPTLQKVSTRAIRTPQISKSKALLEHFVATQDSRAQHRELEEDDWAWEEGATFVFLTVLEEACQEAAEQVAKELLSVRVGAQRMVETLLVQVRVVVIMMVINIVLMSERK